MKLPEHIFREYDIRGFVEKDLSEELAYLIGRAYAKMAKEAEKNNISIGYDCRHTSLAYAGALARGLNDEGIDATILGMGPTPVVYWSLFNYDFGGGIQVTGSHNPSDMNGFKLCLGQNSLFGEDIQKIKTYIQDIIQKNPPKAELLGETTDKEILKDYIAYLIKNSTSFQGRRKLKIVVDAGNGVAGMVGPEALRGLGHEVIELYCEPDGNFPNHHPDPTVPKYLKDLQAKVKETQADFGIGWDGDGDRIGLVDEKGGIIYGDMLVLIYAREILKEIPDATVIADVKCSSLLFDDINQRGGKAVMWKTGHSLIKTKLKELGAELAGEMSGHIFFKHRFYGFDCASYCSCRLAEIVSHTDRKVSELLSDLPPMVNTPEIRMDCPEELKFKIIEKAKEVFNDYEVDDTDGLRIQFDYGWGLMRASNTQPVLVMRFEATDQEKLNEYQSLVTRELDAIKNSL